MVDQALRRAPALRPGQGDRRAAGRHEEPAGHRGAARRWSPARSRTRCARTAAEPTSEQVGSGGARAPPRGRRGRLPALRQRLQGIRGRRTTSGARSGLLTKTTAPKRPRAEPVAELLDDVPDRALAVYAHPDDPDVSCGGTLAAWAKAGCEVHVAHLHRRRQGDDRPGDATPVELAARRAAEAAEAGGVLGLAGQEFLGYPDGELADDAGFREALVAAVRRLRPDDGALPRSDRGLLRAGLLQPPRPPDHRLRRARRRRRRRPRCPTTSPRPARPTRSTTVLLSGTLEPDVWVDISGHGRRQGRGGGVSPEPVPRRRGMGRDRGAARRPRTPGAQAGVPFAEGFRRLRLGG